MVGWVAGVCAHFATVGAVALLIWNRHISSTPRLVPMNRPRTNAPMSAAVTVASCESGVLLVYYRVGREIIWICRNPERMLVFGKRMENGVRGEFFFCERL